MTGNSSNDHYDKDVERGSLPDDMPHDEKLRNTLTNSMTLTPDMFERMYLSPKGQRSNDLTKKLGNPTPVALLGFSVGLFPLSIAFMGWRGSGGDGIATTAATIWFGGVLLLISGIGEFLLGNTFPMIVFFGYGAHFLTLSTTFVPWFNAVGYYAPSTEGTPGDGMKSPEFLASFAFYSVAIGLLSLIFLLGALRTNLVFVFIFVFAATGFFFGGAGFWFLAKGNMEYGTKLIVGLGSCFFAADVLGWYLFLALMIQTMELPLPDLPIFDLSTIIKARPRGIKKDS